MLDILFKRKQKEINAKPPKYIIGTGWWCDETGSHPGSAQKHIHSWEFVRKKKFFDIWYYFVNKYTTPEKIIITDSNSPVKPDLPSDPRIEYINLSKNFGHAIVALKNKEMSGWDRSVLNGALYAYLNDVDYFIYIEQDCLVRGAGWPLLCFDSMKNGKIMLGYGNGTPQPIQQSLIVIKRSFIIDFMRKITTDWNGLTKVLQNEKQLDKYSPEKRYYMLFKRDIDFLPFGYGRTRPIDFEDKYLYAQHWTREELWKFCASEKLDLRILC